MVGGARRVAMSLAMCGLPVSVCWQRTLRALLLLAVGVSVPVGVGATMPGSSKFYTIHWNLTNPIFRIDNTDNVIDVNRNNLQFEYDQVNLICPVYTTDMREEEMEKYIIYNVSKDEYETCRITNPNPRIIAVCDKPYKLMYFTITFRPYTPQPGGLEFLPGHDYYFISTSTSDDLHRRIGGRCTTHNMKIVFKVWAPPPEATTTSTSSSSTTTNQPPSLDGAGNGNGTLTPQQRHPGGTVYRPAWSSRAPPYTATTPPTVPTTLRGGAAGKKVKTTYDKHPNEVGKSEELTLGGTSSGGAGSSDNDGNSSANGVDTIRAVNTILWLSGTMIALLQRELLLR